MADSAEPDAWQARLDPAEPAAAAAAGVLASPIPPPPALSVVIPAHNESESILELLDEVSRVLTGRIDFEAIVVDDGSTDAMDQRLAAALPARPWLRVLRHRRQSGQSAALLTGVRAARAPWIATLDGDGQNDPADIVKLWAARHETGEDAGFGLIAGYRAKRRDSLAKKLSSRIANRVRGALLADHTPDTGCGLKLFERQAFLDLPHFDHVHRFLPALFLRAGRRVVSVPVNHRPRLRGRSHYGVGNRLWVGIVDLLGVMWLKRRSRLPEGVDELAGKD